MSLRDTEIERRVEEECKYDDELEKNGENWDEDVARSDKVREDVDFLTESESISAEKSVCEDDESHIREQMINVKLNRMDCVDDGVKVRVLNDVEKLVLKRLREVFYSDEFQDIPSLKGKDRRLLMEEVNLVNMLIPNIKFEKVNVISVNRLLYASSLVVCEELGLI